MASKREVMEQLTEKGIDYDPNSSKAELEGLLEKAGSSPEKEDVTQPEPEKPKDLAPQAKNYADRRLDPSIGQREVVPGPGLEIIVLDVVEDKDKLLKLQNEGRLVHYDPSSGKAAIKVQ